MASRDLSRVFELSDKAFELDSKGHYARAVEKYAAALAAAQALSQAHCLVVTQLRLMRCAGLRAYADTQSRA